MKKFLILLLLLLSTSVYASGVLDFTADTTPTSDDIIYVINDPVGVPGDRKVTIGNLSKGMIGGATTQVQFNEAGVFGGDAEFTWNTTSKVLTVNTGGLTLGTGAKLLLPNGSVAAPSLAFANFPTLGIYASDASYVKFSGNISTGANDVYAKGIYALADAGTLGLGASLDVLLKRDAANTLALRNGANLQKFNLYNTWLSATSYERLAFTGVAGTSLNITAETADGGGDNLDLIFTPAGTGGVQLGSTKYPLTFTTGDLLYASAANTLSTLPAGTENYILKMGATVPAWTSSLTGITLGGFTASYGVESNASGELVSVQPTGTGLTVRQTTPTLVTPVLGAATATSLLATGIVDGTAPIVITTTSSNYQLGATYKSGYTFINPTSSSASNSVILPAVEAGCQYCVGNYAAKTGTLTVLTKTGSGVQYIDLDGVLTANTGHIQATAVAGNLACFVGLSTSVWKAIPTKGTWTKD